MQQALVRLQQAGCQFPSPHSHSQSPKAPIPLTASQIKINESGFVPGRSEWGSDSFCLCDLCKAAGCGFLFFWHTLCRIIRRVLKSHKCDPLRCKRVRLKQLSDLACKSAIWFCFPGQSWQRLRSKDARPVPEKQVHTSSGSRGKNVPAKQPEKNKGVSALRA